MVSGRGRNKKGRRTEKAKNSAESNDVDTNDELGLVVEVDNYGETYRLTGVSTVVDLSCNCQLAIGNWD